MQIKRSQLRKLIKEILLEAHPEKYGASPGSKRAQQLDDTKEDLESGDPERIERAYRRRERMEKQEQEMWIYCGKWRPVHGVGWQKLFKSFHISHFSVPAAKFFIHFVSLDDEQTSTSTYSTNKIKSFQLRVSI